MVNGEYFTLTCTNVIFVPKCLKAPNIFIYSFKNNSNIIKYIFILMGVLPFSSSCLPTCVMYSSTQLLLTIFKCA